MSQAKRENIIAWVLGVGVVLFAVRPYGMSIGLCLVVIALFALFADGKYLNRETLGSVYIYIPLLIIAISIITSGIYQYFHNHIIEDLIARITLAVLLFMSYLAARIFGHKLLKPFAYAVVIESISVLIFSLFINYGVHNGGITSLADYNVAIALLIFGALVSISNRQWIIVTVAVIGIFFTGAEEGIISVAIIFLVILIRRDYSKMIFVPIVSLLAVVTLGIMPFDYTVKLYANPIERGTMLLTDKHNEQVYDIAESTNPRLESKSNYYNGVDYVLNGRVGTIVTAFQNYNFLFGTGYVVNPVDNKDMPAYNVPLVIAQQVGIIAAIAWVYLTIYCLIKSKWKYAFIAIIILGLFDNITWCQLGIYWWVLIGISTVSIRTNDYLFRANKVETVQN